MPNPYRTLLSATATAISCLASIVDSIAKTVGQGSWPGEQDLPPEISSLPPIKRYVG